MIPLFLPADVPWVNDEPLLLGQAWNVVHKLEMPTHGLTGTLGLEYGPVPVLLYSTALVFTHNLVLLVFLRALFFSLSIGVAVWWLARLCPMLSPPIGALAMLSPYYWFYSRLLWDNSFLIPFSALTLVTYISFCRTQAVWKLWLVALGMALMFQTHLMSLALIAAITGHFLRQHKSWAMKHFWYCLLISITGILACLPYLVAVAHHLTGMKARATDWDLAPWFFQLLGGRTFSAVGLDYFFGEGWQNFCRFPVLVWILTGVSALGLLAFWVGLGEAWRSWVRNKDLPGDAPLEFHLFSIILAALVMQIIMNGVTRTSGEPHYYNSTSFCAFILVWLAYSRVHEKRWRWTFPSMHAIAMALVLLSIIGHIHKNEGNTNLHYGPTLGTQLDVLKRLDFQNPQTTVVNQYSRYPQALQVLQLFYPLRYSTNAPVTRLVIRYADPQAGAGRLEVAKVGR
jgi:hypothetical protein